MSSLSQANKRKKQRAADRPADAAVITYDAKEPAVKPLVEPRFTAWRPEEDENPHRRFWQMPRNGDIVHCRFPNFMRDIHESSLRKVRPAMVVGVQQFPSGEVLVLVAYGTSRVEDDLNSRNRPVLGHGLDPGELLVEAADLKSGLERDTKFCMRKVIKLPFDNDWFAPHPALTFGVYPKRGHYNLDNPVNQRAMNSVIQEAKSLGSLLDGDGPSAKLKKYGF